MGVYTAFYRLLNFTSFALQFYFFPKGKVHLLWKGGGMKMLRGDPEIFGVCKGVAVETL